MKKSTYRLREITFETELVGENIVTKARGYNKQAVTVSIPGSGSKSYTMDGTFLQILEYPAKDMSGKAEITITVGTYDVLQIKKNIFGIKVVALDSY